jgi:hypothetical protein
MNDSPECTVAGAGYGTSGSGGGSGYPGMPVYISDHSCDKAENCTDFPTVDEDCVNKELAIGTKIGRFLPPFNHCQSFVWEVVHKCSTTNASSAYINYSHLVRKKR